MNFRVVPSDGFTVPSSSAHVSSVRTLVVPTATTRPPRPRAASLAAGFHRVWEEVLAPAFTREQPPLPMVRRLRGVSRWKITS